MQTDNGTAVNNTNNLPSAETNQYAIPLLGSQGFRYFRLYNVYRIVIALALMGIASGALETSLIKLFDLSSLAYLIINIVLIISLRKPPNNKGILLLVFSDIIYLAFLFFAAGGITSGIGSLLVISVAIGNIFVRGRAGLLLSAIACVTVIFFTFYFNFSEPQANSYLLQAGTVGSLCFAVAFFVQAITKRISETESLAQQRASNIADLQALNELILQHMKTGIVVVDQQLRILQSNHSANRMFNATQLKGQLLKAHSNSLIKSIEQWQKNSALNIEAISLSGSDVVVQPTIERLNVENQTQFMIFLEDVSQITQHAQHLKLVSLGRLTAGIAHEIRNPLGAVSHAAQLLQESEELDDADHRLTQIVLENSRRMNTIIENVLQLSRQRGSEPQLLDLRYWLYRYLSNNRSKNTDNQRLDLQVEGNNLQTYFDPVQLDQILDNLVGNGLRHSAKVRQQAVVTLHLYKHPVSDLPMLDVIDNGLGVAAAERTNIFEPFFTTENKGTGLGLYISSQLCESNKARLDYIAQENAGACFRITFSQPN